MRSAWQLGWVRYRLGDWRESAEASRKALELESPDLPTGQEMLARLEARHRELLDRSVVRTSEYRDASLERSG